MSGYKLVGYMSGERLTPALCQPCGLIHAIDLGGKSAIMEEFRHIMDIRGTSAMIGPIRGEIKRALGEEVETWENLKIYEPFVEASWILDPNYNHFVRYVGLGRRGYLPAEIIKGLSYEGRNLLANSYELKNKVSEFILTSSDPILAFEFLKENMNLDLTSLIHKLQEVYPHLKFNNKSNHVENVSYLLSSLNNNRYNSEYPAKQIITAILNLMIPNLFIYSIYNLENDRLIKCLDMSSVPKNLFFEGRGERYYEEDIDKAVEDLMNGICYLIKYKYEMPEYNSFDSLCNGYSEWMGEEFEKDKEVRSSAEELRSDEYFKLLKQNKCNVLDKEYENLRKLIASDSNAPRNVLRELAKDKSFSVRLVVLRNPNISGDMLRELAKDHNVRKSVAENLNTPEDVLRELAEDGDRSVRLAVAENSNTPEDVLRELAEGTRHHNTPYDEYEDRSVRLAVAKNSNTPEDVLRKLAKDEKDEVRFKVALNRNTPLDVLRELAKDEKDEVREGVTRNPNTPEEVLRELAKDEKDEVREGVAWNPNTPEEVLRELAEDEDISVRRSVARNPNTPKDVLRELAKDEDGFIRRYVAENLNTPEDVLRELAEDGDRSVRLAVAENSNTPEDVLRELAEDGDRSVRLAVAENSNTPEDVLRELAEGTRHHNTPYDEYEDRSVRSEDALRKLAEDEESLVRKEVAGNRNTPLDVLRELAEDEESLVRKGVALNPNTSLEILKIIFYINHFNY